MAWDSAEVRTIKLNDGSIRATPEYSFRGDKLLIRQDEQMIAIEKADVPHLLSAIEIIFGSEMSHVS